MLIEKDTWVTVRYRLFDAQGEALESGERELTYLQGGYGSVFVQIEQALEGQAEGYSTTVHLEPEDSFGDYDADLIQLAPRDKFPEDLEVGMSFEGLPDELDDPDAEPLIHIVTDITDEVVVLDANHPLAGMALRFELRVVSVREASEEEIEREREMADDQQGARLFSSYDSSASDDADDDEFSGDDEDDSLGAREARRLH